MQPSVGLPPPLQNAADPPVAKRRRDGANATDFPYWSINLAKLLIRRRIATMSPHAATAAASRAHFGGRAGGQKRERPRSEQPRRRARHDRYHHHQHDRHQESADPDVHGHDRSRSAASTREREQLEQAHGEQHPEIR